MLRAFVSNRGGQSLILNEGGYVLQDFILYRSYDNVYYQQIASIQAVEGQPFYQYRDFLMGENHHEFYYRLTALYLSDEGETCESDFATALYNPEQNFVWIDDYWSVDEKQTGRLEIFPNPVQGKLFVEANDIRFLAVFDALGQCVFSQETTSDAAQIDLGGFRNGLYLLKVRTKNGVMTRRFIVSH